MTSHNGDDKVKNIVNKGLESAREIIEEQATRLKQKVDDLDVEAIPGEVKSFVKKNPWTSAAIAAGLGFLVGYIAKSSSRNDD
jgi:ElaB/YqjD/DUF883 family membrane-anchored ribosome-binding protein